LEKHRLYAAKSEKSADQAELFDEVDCAEADGEAQDSAALATPSKPAQKRSGRKPLPACKPCWVIEVP
jgi:hypothetical protein